MANLVTKTIGSNAREYATVALWEAAIPADLVAANEQWTGECYNDSEFVVTSEILFANHTSNVDCYIELTTGAGESFTDHANKATNALRYNQSNGVGITGSLSTEIITVASTSPYIRLSKLQIENTNRRSIEFIGVFCTADNCIFAAEYNHSVLSINGQDAAITNSVLYGTNATSLSHIITIAYQSRFDLTNCTLYSETTATNGVRKQTGAGTPPINGCNIFNVINPLDATRTWSGDYNATDSATINLASLNNLVSLVTTDQFEGVTLGAQDFRVKAGADIIDAAIPFAATNDLDIVFQARSLTTPTIGAWEFQGAGTTPVNSSHATSWNSSENINQSHATSWNVDAAASGFEPWFAVNSNKIFQWNI